MKSLILFLTFLLFTGCSTSSDKSNASAIFWHEDFYKNLNSDLTDLSNPMTFFSYVFSNLRENVSVFPSENFYYFSFIGNGKLIRGNISLHASTRDNGELEFTYYEVGASDPSSPFKASLNLNEKDGVKIKKIALNHYAVSFQGKTVQFDLKSNNDTALYAKTLFPGEQIVLNSNDESGLDFQLIYDNSKKYAYYVLNPQTLKNETFELVDKNLIVGNRTQFVFYHIKDQNKIILVGAHANNVFRNEWYDGPFDQMADNAVYENKLNIKEFYSKVRPDIKPESINKYGIKSNTNRIAIMPYSVYSSLKEIKKMLSSCEKKWKKHGQEFIKCITTEAGTH